LVVLVDSIACLLQEREALCHIEAFRDWVAELPETVGVFIVSGSDDFLIHVAVQHTDSLYAFVIDRLTDRPRSLTCVHLSCTSTFEERRPNLFIPARMAPANSLWIVFRIWWEMRRRIRSSYAFN
jgi:hypothetical protein